MTLATAHRDGVARVREPGARALLAELRGHGGAVSDAAFSPDGRRLATAAAHVRDGRVVSDLRLWETRTWSQEAVIPRLADPLSCLAFSPDGATLGTGDAAAGPDFSFKLWSLPRRVRGAGARL